MATQTIQEMLDDARMQYHSLQTGNKARVIVDQNGERVEFSQADANKLFLYIKSLERMLGVGDKYGPARVTL